MANTAIIQAKFNGGIAISSKSGSANAARFTRNLDIFNDADSVKPNPKTVKVSGSTVVDLIKWIVPAEPWTSDIFAIGDGGNIYRITPADDTITKVHTISSSLNPTGQGLAAVLADTILYANETTLGVGQYISGTLTYTDDYLTDGTNNLDLTQTGSGNTYTTPTSISEASTGKISITPTKDPLASVILTVGSVGTGDVTVTIHDSNNTSLGSKTIAHASLTAAATTFTFANAIRINIGQTYHIHVTSTVADTTIQTGTASDLSTAAYSTLFGILIKDTNYHPIIVGTNGTTGQWIIGNSNYMATYDYVNGYNPNKIEIEPGFTIRGWTTENEFYVALAWRGSTVDETEEGKLFYWDGISKYYNYSTPVAGGVPNAAVNSKNRIFSVLGSRGMLYLGDNPFHKLQPAPQLGVGNKVEVIPGGITTWQDRVLLGYTNADDNNFEAGVYEFGNQSDRAITYTDVSTEVLNYSYTISTGNSKNQKVSIGAVFGHGKYLYIAWKDTTSGTVYGLDKVTKGGSPAASGSWESLITDIGVLNGQLASMPEKSKIALRLIITHAPLPSGVTITPKYKLDRAASWTNGTTNSTDNTTRTPLIFATIGGVRYREIEYGFDFTASTNIPQFTGTYFEFDPLIGEENSE